MTRKIKEHEKEVISSQTEFYDSLKLRKEKIDRDIKIRASKLRDSLGDIDTSDIRTKADGPKFTMRIKPTKINKNSHSPGPGSYATIEPLHSASPTYSIGNSQRSNLGASSLSTEFKYSIPVTQGNRYSFPKDPKLKITDNDNQPGPGLYEIETSIGSIPKYLKEKSPKNKIKGTV